MPRLRSSGFRFLSSNTPGSDKEMHTQQAVSFQTVIPIGMAPNGVH
jgi:hypothetical protein